MSQPSAESRVSIIDAVKNPLAFLVLGLLVVDGTMASLAVAFPEFRLLLVWTVIVSLLVFVLIVVGLAVWRPEALRGDRPLQEVYANQLASDLFLALDGALSNLEPLERTEAWLTVADVITTGREGDAGYSKFCSAVADRLKKLTNLASRPPNTRGPIAP
ncbi:hypothetical protein ACW73L_06025 [Methylolobus aquaticus]